MLCYLGGDPGAKPDLPIVWLVLVNQM